MKKLTIIVLVCISLVSCTGSLERKGNVTFIKCENAPDTYVLSDINGKPQGAGAMVELIKIEGDQRCYLASEFAHASNPDACPEVHFHGEKHSVDGQTRIDTHPESCGVAMTSQLEYITAYEWPGEHDEPRDTTDEGDPNTFIETVEKTGDCCGPDVTDSLMATFKKIVSDWNGWDETERKNRCETIVDVEYAADSWDIREFFNGDALLWTPRDCGTGECKRTVQVAGGCWLDQVANYAMWGVMTKLCEEVSVGAYDRMMLDGVAQWGWTVVVAKIANGGNVHKEGQDAMARAGYEATHVRDGIARFAAWKFKEEIALYHEVSVHASCGKCESAPMTPIPDVFQYRWRNEG